MGWEHRAFNPTASKVACCICLLVAAMIQRHGHNQKSKIMMDGVMTVADHGARERSWKRRDSRSTEHGLEIVPMACTIDSIFIGIGRTQCGSLPRMAAKANHGQFE